MPSRYTPAQFDEIVRRSATDPAFRSQLISDPASAVQEALGESLPPTVRLKFIEKPADCDALIVLPEFAAGSASLSDAELEAVAGGDGTDADFAACPWTCSLSCDVTVI